MKLFDAIETIKKTAKQNSERPKAKKIRVVKNLKIGEGYRQGDIYVIKVPDNYPVGEELDRRQIADGFSIGARHSLVGKFKVYRGVKAPNGFSDLHSRVGLGYAFDVLEIGTMNIHPEHDHFLFEQLGRYQVMHQVDLRTQQRVAD